MKTPKKLAGDASPTDAPAIPAPGIPPTATTTTAPLVAYFREATGASHDEER